MSDTTDTVTLAADLTAAWLANPNTRASAGDVPNFLRSTFEALGGLSVGGEPVQEERAPQEYSPAVSVRKSLANPDHIISLIDGKPYKTLRRHLATTGLTPHEYLARYGLKKDYPMTAPNYSEARRSMAKQIGLGRKSTKPGNDEAVAASETAKPKRRTLKIAADS